MQVLPVQIRLWTSARKLCDLHSTMSRSDKVLAVPFRLSSVARGSKHIPCIELEVGEVPWQHVLTPSVVLSVMSTATSIQYETGCRQGPSQHSLGRDLHAKAVAAPESAPQQRDDVIHHQRLHVQRITALSV